MSALPIATKCYWKRHDVVIYLARNDGAKMLRMRQHFPRCVNFDTDLSPVDEYKVKSREQMGYKGKQTRTYEIITLTIEN